MKLETTTAKTAFDYKFLLKRLYPYIKPFWFRILLTFLLAIPLGLLDGATAFALKPYIDVVVNGNEMVLGTLHLTRDILVNLIPFLIVGFAVVQGLLRYLNSYLTDWISNKISNLVKIDLFKKLIKMDTKFFDENSSGIILTRFLTDPDTASRTVVDSLKHLITCSVEALGLIAVLLWTSWKLAVVGVIVLTVAFLPLAFIRKKIKKISNETAVLGGGWMSPIMYLIASIGIAIVMSIGNILIINGEMTTGSFASFVTSLLLLYKPVKDLGRTLTNLQNVFVAAARVFELFDLMPEIKNRENAIELKGIKDKITFENVVFEYVENEPVIKGVSFEINKGETVALVGNSGGGKSTIVNLLPRFYDIKSGSIKIDNIDIRDFTLESLRMNISEVFQDNFLFSGTIKENILMGNYSATEEDIDEVVRLSHLDEFISTLDKGLDTVLGEMGTSLSGGQRQRVAIARAMLKKAPVIILDEATSALDNKSEAIVQKALENLMRNKTVFVIAHRLSTIKNADKIMVINDGHLVEQGRHDELLQIQNGQYKALYEMQFNKNENFSVV